MKQVTTVGVELAKDVIQICVVSGSKVKENKALSASQLENWLASSSSSTVVFEACMTANKTQQLPLF